MFCLIALREQKSNGFVDGASIDQGFNSKQMSYILFFDNVSSCKYYGK